MTQTPEQIAARKAAKIANREARRKAIREALDLNAKQPPMGALLPRWAREAA